MIAIVDYNVGNLQSVINAFSSLQVKATLVSDPNALKNYDKAILPGVGAFGDAMRSLEKTQMKEAVLEYAKSGKSIMGICLGMQLLFEKSYEFGEHEGLGLIPGVVKKFDTDQFQEPLKIPHIGWNSLHVKNKTSLFDKMQKEFYLYFVHSYYVDCSEKYVVGKTKYGVEFTSAVVCENIFGIQPHPEKSHENGLQILKNFAQL